MNLALHKYVDTRYVYIVVAQCRGFIYIIMLCAVIGWHLELRVWKDTTYLP